MGDAPMRARLKRGRPFRHHDGFNTPPDLAVVKLFLARRS